MTKSLDLTPEQLAYIRVWAARTPTVAVVWLYGSRAKGTARSDSDVDIAIEVHPKANLSSRDTFLEDMNWAVWEDELAEALDLRVHMVQLRGDETPTVLNGVLEAGIVMHRNLPPADSAQETRNEEELFREAIRDA